MERPQVGKKWWNFKLFWLVHLGISAIKVFLWIFFLKMAHSRTLFLYFRLFNTVDSKQMLDKACWWLDSNCRSLVSEATALPTEPQPLPIIKANFSNNRSRKNSVLKIFFDSYCLLRLRLMLFQFELLYYSIRIS